MSRTWADVTTTWVTDPFTWMSEAIVVQVANEAELIVVIEGVLSVRTYTPDTPVGGTWTPDGLVGASWTPDAGVSGSWTPDEEMT